MVDWSQYINSYKYKQCVNMLALTGSDAFGRPSAPITTSLANGADELTYHQQSNMVVMSTTSETTETQDVSFLIVGSTRTSNGDVLTDHNSIVNQLIQIAENRKDCMVIAFT